MRLSGSQHVPEVGKLFRTVVQKAPASSREEREAGFAASLAAVGHFGSVASIENRDQDSRGEGEPNAPIRDTETSELTSFATEGPTPSGQAAFLFCPLGGRPFLKPQRSRTTGLTSRTDK